MELTRNFTALGKNDAAIAGGKGASLGEMTQAGIPVPPGFVVLSAAFERFLDETDLQIEIAAILDTVDQKEMHTVEHASEKIQALILNAQMPVDIAQDIKKYFAELDTEFVAVRSSATAEDSANAAWAGQLDSFLNTTEVELLKNVQKCWASLFTPRAIFYRFEKKLHLTKISVAVVVQKMVQSESAGIAFSVHPVTEDRNQLIIEAGFGLGDQIVSGEITPDSYVVEKSPRNIIDINISQTSQVLSEPQILELSDLVVKIENHYGFPCDIEWAFEAGRFYIVQSRPITTLKKAVLNAKKKLSRKDFVFTFESQGTSFIFEDFVANHYIPKTNYGEWIKICREGLVQVFASKKTLELMDKEGLSRSPASTEAVIGILDSLIEATKAELAGYRKELDFSRQDTLHMSTQIGKIFQEYQYFDFAYWDSVFAVSKNNPKAQEIVSLVEGYKNKVRAELNEICFNNDSYLLTLLDKLSTKFSIPLNQLQYYRETDLLNLYDGKKVSDEELEKRKHSDSYHKTPEGMKFCSGADAEELLAIFERKTGEMSGETIMGKVASGSGVVRGLLRIITRDYNDVAAMHRQMNEMAQGEILLSETTDPEMMPALRKAAALITDIGGMLSHGAITARELGIPCIIETENATKILKTGDMVEVDANRGFVKVLK